MEMIELTAMVEQEEKNIDDQYYRIEKL